MIKKGYKHVDKILIKFRDICKMEEYVKSYKHKYVKCMHYRINMMMCNIIAIVNLWIHLSHQMYVIVKFFFLLSLSLSLSLSLYRSLYRSLSFFALFVRACMRTLLAQGARILVRCRHLVHF